MIPYSYGFVMDSSGVIFRYISHKITDIIKFNYSQKLNVLKFLWIARNIYLNSSLERGFSNISAVAAVC